MVQVFLVLCSWLEWLRATTSTTVRKITVPTAVISAVARILGKRTAKAASPAPPKTPEASSAGDLIIEHTAAPSPWDSRCGRLGATSVAKVATEVANLFNERNPLEQFVLN